MSKPRIVQAGSPVLRAAAAPVARDQITSRDTRLLVKKMVETMRQAPGVGLAAPQIGVSLQVIVLEDDNTRMARLTKEQREERGRAPFPLTVVFNPELRVIGDEKATYFEGCLSVAGYMALVERHFAVEVTGLDEKGEPLRWEARGWPARILQHEVDHLRGVLYVDRMITRTLACNDEMGARWLEAPVAEVKKVFGVE
ncbi:peptide deformylase [Polyangium mundeleinium]|uniref:Peptide deformylase n=1 Tax=Polyangium mundeleinium TaxID=2995306 RepID=A0ABT5ETE8_9BACT|nr:peptide deformylase [Polyangium mundeleinium]MDC0745100.1 peptide deformylase [Polyangium mundeleinium]